MAIVLGRNQYGKAETRVVRIVRDTPRHEITDLNVSTALRGDFSAAHLAGDQRAVLPTDTQKWTVYAWAKSHPVEPVEAWALSLAHHFVDDVGPVESARIEVERFDWTRLVVDGAEHDHAFTRTGQEVRTAAVTLGADGVHVVQGVRDLVILKSTGSAFKDFLVDEYTVLEPTEDRVLATALTARWRLTDPAADTDWDALHADVKAVMLKAFATLRSDALQQTLWFMGRAALEAHPEIAEIRFSAPNKHHFVVDLSKTGLTNDNEVFNADDRPYGLIQADVLRDDAAPAGDAWWTYSGLV